MAKKKLSEVLGKILKKPVVNEEAPIMTMIPDIPPYDIRDDAERRGKYHEKRWPPCGLEMPSFDEKEEPMDKVLVAIQHHFINGDFDKASELIQTFRGASGGKFFTWYHMNQLMDWVRNIYKYTNMRDLSRNYYNYEMSKDMKIQGVDDLTKVKVRDEVVEKFVKEVEKVLKKKLEMR
jgi:hypothetical protein